MLQRLWSMDELDIQALLWTRSIEIGMNMITQYNNRRARYNSFSESNTEMNHIAFRNSLFKTTEKIC